MDGEVSHIRPNMVRSQAWLFLVFGGGGRRTHCLFPPIQKQEISRFSSEKKLLSFDQKSSKRFFIKTLAMSVRTINH